MPRRLSTATMATVMRAGALCHLIWRVHCALLVGGERLVDILARDPELFGIHHREKGPHHDQQPAIVLVAHDRCERLMRDDVRQDDILSGFVSQLQSDIRPSAVEHNSANVLPVVGRNVHRHREALAAGPQCDLSNATFPRLEGVRLPAIAQHESFELSKAVEHHMADFPGVFMFVAFSRTFGRHAVSLTATL